jgi:hypothetical protein
MTGGSAALFCAAAGAISAAQAASARVEAKAGLSGMLVSPFEKLLQRLAGPAPRIIRPPPLENNPSQHPRRARTKGACVHPRYSRAADFRQASFV